MAARLSVLLHADAYMHMDATSGELIALSHTRIYNSAIEPRRARIVVNVSRKVGAYEHFLCAGYYSAGRKLHAMCKGFVEWDIRILCILTGKSFMISFT